MKEIYMHDSVRQNISMQRNGCLENRLVSPLPGMLDGELIDVVPVGLF